MSEQLIVRSQESLDTLAAEANLEHERAVKSGVEMIHHAIRAGEALWAAKSQCRRGDWMGWLDANFHASHATAQGYIRVATHKELVLAALEKPTLGGALRYLRGLPPTDEGLHTVPAAIRDEAVRLAQSGVSHYETGRLLGVDPGSVACWVDPSRRKRKTAQHRQWRIQRRAEKRALLQQERERAIRQLGDAVAESYSMIRKTAQIVQRASEGTDDREVRVALDAALRSLHHAEDEIVRAVGIA